jgi:hypothetical protein
MSPLPVTLLLKLPCAETDALFFILLLLLLCKSTELLNFRRKPRGEHGVNVNVLRSDTLAR